MDDDEHPALVRVRILRRDAYRCQHRDTHGIPCGAPASNVADGAAACWSHR